MAKEISVNANKINVLARKSPSKEISAQGTLDLSIEADAEVGDIGMGVLSDGTPYLNQRGLAAICGVQNAHIGTISSQWSDVDEKPRIKSIKTILAKAGQTLGVAHVEISHAGRTHYCYPAEVCLAVMEYYAFDAGANCQDVARDNFRRLAGSKLREMIYHQVGYDPAKSAAKVWQQFLDRVSLAYDKVPPGYFSIFKEAADIIVTLIRGGAPIGPHFIPDGSIGIFWARHWKDNDLATKFGERRKYLHDYPGYFPQAASNPQTPYCYPDAALAEFRRWMRDTYIVDHLPDYLRTKQRQCALPPSFSDLALAALGSRNNASLIS